MEPAQEDRKIQFCNINSFNDNIFLNFGLIIHTGAENPCGL
jgi:hypothetical protein